MSTASENKSRSGWDPQTDKQELLVIWLSYKSR